MKDIYVSADSKPQKVAGFIASNICNEDMMLVWAVGAKAVNQAVKAITIARQFCIANKKDIIMQSEFAKKTLYATELINICFKIKAVPLTEQGEDYDTICDNT